MQTTSTSRVMVSDMHGRALLRCTLIATLCVVSPAHGQSPSLFADYFGADEADWRPEATAVAMAPDGTWGVATGALRQDALVKAIEDCRRKTRRGTGCGSQSLVTRGGWVLGFRCGTHNLLLRARTLLEAEQAALRAEAKLSEHDRDLPMCVLTLAVNPNGDVIPAHIVSRTFSGLE